MPIALVREVSPTLASCELTHLAREPLDIGRAGNQHRQYTDLLSRLGCEVHWIPEAPELPDAVFVEDTAVVVDEIGVISRPGAESRRPETPTMASVLARFRRIVAIAAPGTLDGGDVLRVGRTIYVGRSERTNADGVAQLERLLAPYGYRVRAVEVHGCLHLKSAVTEVAEGTLLYNPAWVDARAFAGHALLDIDPAEPFAANGLRIGPALVYPEAFPRTRARLEQRGIGIAAVDLSELAKAEGAVTCCSVVFERGSANLSG
ncbi:MAG TPA: arginine deiminase family protein [Gemmatimonadales bacterium]|jgi:dimethylargininase|nr:arginine deiminase family protein [Gemmatimonadales bacterium]